MKDEMEVMDALRMRIIDSLSSFIREPGIAVTLDERSVLIDFPDPDNMARDSVVWITPDWENIEELSVATDVSTLRLSVYIVCKGSSFGPAGQAGLCAVVGTLPPGR